MLIMPVVISVTELVTELFMVVMESISVTTFKKPSMFFWLSQLALSELFFDNNFM